MTAEIAILNKSAVALAADSAVTISAGKKQEKIFDSADKLFELSHREPIGIMVYNGMSFMDMPLPTLIKQFRECCDSFKTIEDAAKDFLKYLNELGKKSPAEIYKRNISDIVNPILEIIHDRHQDEFMDAIFSQEAKNPEETSLKIISDLIKEYNGKLRKMKAATFIGKNSFRLDVKTKNIIKEFIDRRFHEFSEVIRERLGKLAESLLKKNYFSATRTGIVVAGFGQSEIFPTLVYYEIDGMICGGLKYSRVGLYDIDRVKEKAAIIPFAQKEMVDRFLYGLDDEIKKDIRQFCEESVKNISDEIFDRLTLKDADQKSLEKKARSAETSFVSSLESRAFKAIREKSRREIEDIVEFMPKPELAKMAEALVELTSIKRRVSRGMETVGGPIDVAVISKTEGFVWVKRKLYFPAELNARYFVRVKNTMNQLEQADGK